MMRAVVAFIRFVHEAEDGDGSMTNCHNMICRWAARREKTVRSEWVRWPDSADEWGTTGYEKRL